LTGDAVPIAGFVIEGTAPKRVIVRAIGPSLPLFGSLADPTLSLFGGDGRVLTSNDNWREHESEVMGTARPPPHEREAAIVATLTPGAYTAILRGVNGSTGITLVEVYDLTPESASRIANLSTRGRVETGDNVMIGGFVVTGTQPMRVIVRALGPSLGLAGVQDALANPTLDLFDSSGTRIATNDNWASDQVAEISSSGFRPSDTREAAIIRTLPPGAYTAIVRGKDGASGVALVELFNLDQ
jgi:hypothetical protein